MRTISFSIIIIVLSILSCSKERNVSNNFYYDKAFDFKDAGNEDSAYAYFYKAKYLFSQKNDSIGVGKSLINLAIISTQKGDNLGGQETSLEATKYFNDNNKQDYAYIKSNYNNLGISSYNLKQYQEALKFYDLAIKFSDETPEKNIYLNNKANVLKQLKKYNEAITIYENIYTQIQKGSSKELARVMANLARVKWLQNPSYNPEPELLKAMEIRVKANDREGLIVNYLYLCDYYEKQNPNEALEYAKKMLDIAKKVNNPDDQTEALQKMINLDPVNRLVYFNDYQHLNDSLQTARNKAKNQFALIRFGAEKLKTENVQKENQILKQNIGIAALGICLIAGFIIYKRKQSKLQLEVKNTELKYSKKVHDKVANKVYHVMSEVENITVIDKNELLDKLESIYHISRDISYEDKDLALEKDFSKQLSKMLKSYSSEIIKVPIIGNEEELWNGVSEIAKIEVFYILQEFMTNMKKHSKADRVMIDFERENNLVTILYSDNGVGIHKHIPKNGLKNTESRINSINGTINFETQTEKGLKINLSFPVKK
ncbi:ATP-binding protein [Chryseobacterium phosphatilyticum]|uniref:ATP-binding protein n=1 Tax=Chryseobacterium phosphatilyticum TaxID=475075 RepID=A0A316WZL3_9FLAO|nr:tetratricopeptide repeat-containing sensor histidine kinase [Chryseobacterium phosphatilyticum]PWN66795.1 ATP-binding protein [Chryseobacterium phosphatilyticum]